MANYNIPIPSSTSVGSSGRQLNSNKFGVSIDFKKIAELYDWFMKDKKAVKNARAKMEMYNDVNKKLGGKGDIFNSEIVTEDNAEGMMEVIDTLGKFDAQNLYTANVQRLKDEREGQIKEEENKNFELANLKLNPPTEYSVDPENLQEKATMPFMLQDISPIDPLIRTQETTQAPDLMGALGLAAKGGQGGKEMIKSIYDLLLKPKPISEQEKSNIDLKKQIEFENWKLKNIPPTEKRNFVEEHKEMRNYDVTHPLPGTNIQERKLEIMENKETKKEEKEAKKEQAKLDTAISKADIVMGKIDEALSQVGITTTGLTGTVLGKVPGTKAYDLEKIINTIQANIGFNELAEMRAASPTGGALGQIAVKELEFLQAALGSLDKGQKMGTITNNLKAIKEHYSKWKKTLGETGRVTDSIKKPDPLGLR